ncbi:MAG TPA: ester cyclase [Levilinea sp.]|nr:ester cyclase [Levilinea sp.]
MNRKQANREGDEGMLAAFTEPQSTIHKLLVEGDTAAIRGTWKATHSGVSPSLGIPPTGKRVRIVGCSVFHFRNGKIVEQWEYSDMLGMLQQLGVIPAFG